MLIYYYDKNKCFAGVAEIERIEGATGSSPFPAPVTLIAPPDFNAILQKCTFDLDLQQWVLTDIPQPVPDPLPDPEPQPEPQFIVSPRQIRQALTAANLRAQVEAAVAASSQDVQDWWNFATQFEENHQQILAMCIVLGITGEQRHNVFVAAQGL